MAKEVCRPSSPPFLGGPPHLSVRDGAHPSHIILLLPRPLTPKTCGKTTLFRQEGSAFLGIFTDGTRSRGHSEGQMEWEGYLGGIASNDLSLLRLREANYVEKGGMCAVS